jgi:hypothetical protein
MGTSTDTGTGGRPGLQTDSLTPVHWLGVALAAITGVIHLVLASGLLSTPIGVSFLLAGLGFLGALVLLLLGVRRRLLYAVGIPFTGVQIVLWYLIRVQGNGLSSLGALDYVDKAAQIALILVLGYLLSTD